jgi:two-component system C4-dicarboxylate transport response regulator DctD
LSALSLRDWPGHVRELRNAAERMALGLDPALTPPTTAPGASLAQQVADHERLVIAAALAAHGGSIKATYTALRLSRKALYEKMQRHGLNRDSFRED